MKLASDVNYNDVLDKLKASFWQKQADAKASPKYNPDEFEKIVVLGSGAFGTVRLTKHKNSEKYYATKVLLKKHIIKQKQLQHTLQEKKVLSCIKFPFSVYLAFSYKDNDFIYFGMPFINGGELFTHLRNVRRFDESQGKFYAAQVCLAIEYLHYLNLVYRDLKPENMLIDYKGYIKLTDFGFCKIVEGRTWTLCGTPEYLAPEVIQTKGYNKCVDWWSFGILVYEMIAGVSPFYVTTDDPMVLFSKIVEGKYKAPSHFSGDLKNFISNLLQKDITKRYGNLKNGVNDIKNHNWFRNTNWISLLNKEINAPFIPKVKSPGDTSNFEEFHDELERIERSKKCLYEKDFEEF